MVAETGGFLVILPLDGVLERVAEVGAFRILLWNKMFRLSMNLLEDLLNILPKNS